MLLLVCIGLFAVVDAVCWWLRVLSRLCVLLLCCCCVLLCVCVVVGVCDC